MRQARSGRAGHKQPPGLQHVSHKAVEPHPLIHDLNAIYLGQLQDRPSHMGVRRRRRCVWRRSFEGKSGVEIGLCWGVGQACGKLGGRVVLGRCDLPDCTCDDVSRAGGGSVGDESCAGVGEGEVILKEDHVALGEKEFSDVE